MTTRLYRVGLSWLLAIVILGLAVGVPAWLLLHEEYAVGWVVWTHVVPEGNRLLARVETPWTRPRMLLFQTGVAVDTIAGRWLVARGTPQLVGQWHLLIVDTMRTLPLVPAVVKAPDAEGLRRLVGALAQHRGVATLLGAIVLLLGFVFLRLAASKVGGILGAILTWHAVVVAAFEGLLVLPNESTVIVTLLGFAVGALLSGQRGNPLSYLAQRLALILILLACAGEMARQFGWPIGLTQAVTVLAPLLSPALGLWLVGAFLLAVGLGAKSTGSYLILGATGLVIHGLIRGAWVPSTGLPRFLKRQSRRLQPRRDGHEVPLDALVCT